MQITLEGRQTKLQFYLYLRWKIVPWFRFGEFIRDKAEGRPMVQQWRSVDEWLDAFYEGRKKLAAKI